LSQRNDSAFGPPSHSSPGWVEAMLRLTKHTPDLRSHFFAAATLIAAAGLPVFPCVPEGKSPLSRHGFKDATTVGRLLAGWAARWPQANVAIATGGAGADVLDVDKHGNGNGFPALERARSAGLTEGWALILRTPSGGIHLYYPASPERPQRSWSAGDVHIDFRGTGGYVLAPPSTVSQPDRTSRTYQVIAVGRHPRPIDATALKEFLLPPSPPAGIRPAAPGRHTHDLQRIAAWVAGRPEGSRNGSLFWAACRYVDQGLSEHEARRVLLDAALEAGLPAAEAAATIGSAYRHAASHSSSAEHRRGMQW
jgi:hypothetical protein